MLNKDHPPLSVPFKTKMHRTLTARVTVGHKCEPPTHMSISSSSAPTITIRCDFWLLEVGFATNFHDRERESFCVPWVSLVQLVVYKYSVLHDVASRNSKSIPPS